MEASFTVKDLLTLTLKTIVLLPNLWAIGLVWTSREVEFPRDLAAIPIALIVLAGIVYLWVVAYRKAGEWRC